MNSYTAAGDVFLLLYIPCLKSGSNGLIRVD
jgi:hypothetical protein